MNKRDTAKDRTKWLLSHRRVAHALSVKRNDQTLWWGDAVGNRLAEGEEGGSEAREPF